MLTHALLALSLSPRPLPVVHGDLAAPAAWASVHEQQLYVCWHQGTGCFEAVELGAALPSAPTELAFVGPEALVVSDGETAVLVGPRGAQPLEHDLLIPTRRPTILRCSPTGALPHGTPRDAIWIDAPCTGPLCPGPTPARQPRRYAPGLSVGVEILAGNWTRERWVVASPDDLQLGRDITGLLTLTVTLPSAQPPGRAPPQPIVRRLPVLVSGGPPELRRAAEQTARNIVCPEIAR